MFVFLVDDLDSEIPLWVSASLDGVKEISTMEIGICTLWME